MADLIWCLLIILLCVWGWAGDFYSWYSWHCIQHKDKPMGDANKPHDIFLTWSSNGVSWSVCMPEMWQGRHRGLLWWKMGDHFSQDTASCLLHGPCPGPVLQTRTLTRMVKCPCRQGMGVWCSKPEQGGRKSRESLGGGHGSAKLVQPWPCFLQGVVLWWLVPENLCLPNHTAGSSKQAHLMCQEWHSILYPLVGFYLTCSLTG